MWKKVFVLHLILLLFSAVAFAVTPEAVESMVQRGIDAYNSGQTASYFDGESVNQSHCAWFAYKYCLNGSLMGTEGVTVPSSVYGLHCDGARHLLRSGAGTLYIKCASFHTGEEQAYIDKYKNYSSCGGADIVIAGDDFKPQRGDIGLMGFDHNVSGHVVIMTSESKCVYASGNILHLTNRDNPYHTYKNRHYFDYFYGYFRFNTTNAQIDVNFDAPFYDDNTLSAGGSYFKRAWTITKNGRNIQPDDYYYNIYDASGNYLGKVYDLSDGRYECGTQECGIELSADSNYSVESHVIINGTDYSSQRYPFSTDSGYCIIGDHWFSSKEVSECDFKATLIMDTTVSPAEYLTGYGWKLYDANENLIREQDYTVGVNDPAGTKLLYYNIHSGADFSWQLWDRSMGRQKDYEVSLPIHIQSLRPGQTYYIEPYITREHEPLYIRDKRLYFTIPSLSPNVWQYSLQTKSITSTEAVFFCRAVAAREDGGQTTTIVYPSTHNLKIFDADGAIVSEWSQDVPLFLFSLYNEELSLSSTAILSPGSMYSVIFEDEWEDLTIQSDPLIFYTNSTIHYNANGGKDAPEDDEKTYGEKYTLSGTEPARSGYLFIGWADSPDAQSAQYQPGDQITEDGTIVLYALWKPMVSDFFLPETLTSIDAEAFSGLSMTVVKCPDKLKSIGPRSFANCNKLRVIYLPEDIESIDITAFKGCSNVTVYGKSETVAEEIAQYYGFIFIPYK